MERWRDGKVLRSWILGVETELEEEDEISKIDIRLSDLGMMDFAKS